MLEICSKQNIGTFREAITYSFLKVEKNCGKNIGDFNERSRQKLFKTKLPVYINCRLFLTQNFCYVSIQFKNWC